MVPDAELAAVWHLAVFCFPGIHTDDPVEGGQVPSDLLPLVEGLRQEILSRADRLEDLQVYPAHVAITRMRVDFNIEETPEDE